MVLDFLTFPYTYSILRLVSTMQFDGGPLVDAQSEAWMTHLYPHAAYLGFPQ